MFLKEKVLKRLLREAAMSGSENQAGLLQDEGNFMSFTIYDRNLFLRDLKFIKMCYDSRNNEALKEFMYDIMLAFIEITPPMSAGGIPYGPCAGAWMVSAVAGPGYGRNIYGVAYAMSPSGLLVPDRSSVKPKARDAWRKVFSGGERPSIRLDDKEHSHDEPGNEYHTDDPEDDCKLHKDPDDPQLDYAYEEEGWEQPLLEMLSANHEKNMAVLQDPNMIEMAETCLSAAKGKFWKVHYYES